MLSIFTNLQGVITILYRARQFFSAIRAYFIKADRQLVNNYLDKKEQILFDNMDKATQRHAILVAQECLKLAQNYQVNTNLLIKASLLHDTGKVKGDMGIIDRTLVVLLAKINPKLITSLSRKGKGGLWDNFRHALYLYLYHPKIGAEQLKNIGASASLVALVENHHHPQQPGDSKELTLLRQADNMY